MATTESSLQSLLGALVEGRCYPLINKQVPATLPYIIFQEISGRDLLVVAPAKEVWRVQINVYDSTYKGAKDLSDSVKTAMDNTTAFATAMLDRFNDHEQITKEYYEVFEYYVWVG
jgi:hypothetical protein